MPAPVFAGRPKELITDLFGRYAELLQDWVAVADLIALMALLGVDEQAVRSAVSRMTRRELLRSEVRHGRRGYALTGQALALIAQVDARIFTPPPRPRLRDGWVVVSVSVPEAERSRRHLLRNRLTWLGLSGLDGGLWFGPAHRRDEVVASLDLLDLRGAAHVFIAHYDGSGEVADLVRRSWDLDAVEKAYLRFTDVHGPVWERARRAPVDDERAFVDYTLAVHDWRPLPLDDPALPAELLPADWPGVAAAAVFAGLRRRLEPAAFRFVASVVA